MENLPVCPGTGVGAKKYSVESAKPVKFPRGVTRPAAARHQSLPPRQHLGDISPLLLNNPGGVAEDRF
jgi:hypothetical protein